MIGSLLRGNSASVRGGGLYASGGVVELSNGTLFQANTAPRGQGSSVYVASSSRVSYTLPAPISRWLFIASGRETSLDPGAISADYPFSCPAGVVGNSYERDHQSGPQCSSPCDPGYFCPEATFNPQVCPEATYCPLGSPAAIVCPDGTYSRARGAESMEACLPCPQGSWCRAGHAVECSTSTYNPAVGATNEW